MIGQILLVSLAKIEPLRLGPCSTSHLSSNLPFGQFRWLSTSLGGMQIFSVQRAFAIDSDLLKYVTLYF